MIKQMMLRAALAALLALSVAVSTGPANAQGTASNPATVENFARFDFQPQIAALKTQTAEVANALTATVDRLLKTSTITSQMRRSEFNEIRKNLVELGLQLQVDAPLGLAIQKLDDWVNAQSTRVSQGSNPDKAILARYEAQSKELAKCREALAALRAELDSRLERLAAVEDAVTERLLIFDADAAIAQLKDCVEQIRSLLKNTDRFMDQVDAVSKQAGVTQPQPKKG